MKARAILTWVVIIAAVLAVYMIAFRKRYRILTSKDPGQLIIGYGNSYVQIDLDTSNILSESDTSGHIVAEYRKDENIVNLMLEDGSRKNVYDISQKKFLYSNV